MNRDKAKALAPKALVLLSSGIDSPVAAHLMMKKGLELIAIHFNNEPFTDRKQVDKTIRICGILKIKKLYIVPHGKVTAVEMLRKCRRDYNCVICRRMMFRVAERIAEKEGCSYLVTGENLGQVASQTMDNMKVVTEAVNIPILRPVLCSDKNEIKEMAAKIGTYDVSVMPGMCCSHVPDHPATKARIDRILKEEAKLNIQDMIAKSIEDLKVEKL